MPALAVTALLACAPLASADLKLTATVGGGKPPPGARTVPYFSDSFAFRGTVYPYTMVGTNPRTSHATTTVPAAIVPLRLVFADGQVVEPGVAVSGVVSSPLFQNARFTSGTTQYGDAIRRAMFWSYTATDGYHVLLSQPQVLATQTIDVPRGQGTFVPAGAALGTVAGTTVHAASALGVVSESWFDTRLDQLLNALKVSPTTLPIMLSRNVIESNGVAGFHEASTTGTPSGNQKTQTAIWASYGDPYFYAELPGIAQNVDILSHELAEWLHDPFVSNTVPPWRSTLPLASSFYGCSPLLETGDPVADVGFEQNGYQLQDEAFLSWFAHQVPSIGIGGRYTYLGTFSQPAPPC